MIIGLRPKLGLQRRFQRRLQRIAAQLILLARDDLAGIAVHEKRMRDAADAVKLAERRVPALSLVNLRPRHVLLLHRCLQRVKAVRLIERYSQDIQSLAMQLLISGNHAGNFAHARAAPRGPEIDQDNLAFVVAREMNGPNRP